MRRLAEETFLPGARLQNSLAFCYTPDQDGDAAGGRCSIACEFHTVEWLWNSSPSAGKRKREILKGPPASAIRPTGLVNLGRPRDG